jgi:hypothetical protein
VVFGNEKIFQKLSWSKLEMKKFSKNFPKTFMVKVGNEKIFQKFSKNFHGQSWK